MATPRKATTPKKSKEETKKPSSKAIPPKKTQETKKPSSAKKNNSKSIKNNKSKISNGNASDSDVEILSSSSERYTKQNGGKSTKTPSPKSKNGKQKQKQEEVEEEEEEEVKSYTFPMERVRRIIRSEDSDLRISQDAVFLVNKATEKFLEKFCEEAHAFCVKDRKKSLAYKHLSSVVSKRKRYDFLSDFVPEKVKAEDALAKRKLAGAKAG